MKSIILLIFILIFIQPSNSQNKISGKITDKDNSPMIGANIYIPELNKGTVSNTDGKYDLQNLPNGKIKIQFSYIGYINRIETVVLSNNDVELNISLQPTSIESEEIVVSGGYNSTQHENSVKIDVLKIETSLLKQTPNFMEMLTKIPGVEMISKGSGVSKPVIRGLAMNDILVLNNGVRFENYQYSSHHPLGIDEFGIEDVEVIKGPASLLYGSDAIGGVINFIKEKPAPVGSLTGDYNVQFFSNTLGLTNNLGLKGATKNFFAGLRFGQKTNSDFVQGGGKYVPNSRFNEWSLKTNAGFSGKSGTFCLYYDFTKQKLGLVEDEAVEQITSRSRKNEIFYQELNTHLLSSQNTIYFGKLKLNFNSAFQNTELIHFGEIDEYEIQMQLSTLTYEAKLHLPSKTNTEYIIGIQGLNQVNTNMHNRETKLLPNAHTDNYSAFSLLQYAFHEQLKLQVGIRYDYKILATESVGFISDSSSYRKPIDKNYGSFSGSFGATYDFSDELFLRCNFASAYRTPNLAELTSKGQHELRFEIGDESLIAEKSYECDFSIHFHKENFAFDISGFYNKVNHFIYISPTNDTTTAGISIYQYLQNNSFLYGGESVLHFHPKTMEWLHVETTFSTVTGKQENGNFLPFIPANKFQFEIRAEKEKLLFLTNTFYSINIHSSFAQNNIAPEETKTPGYTLVDMIFGGNINIKNQNLIITVGFSNIFDKKYIDHLSTLKEVNFFNPGRNITFSCKIPFSFKK